MTKTLVSKTCNRCNLTKPVDKFRKDSSLTDGYRNQCNDCRNTANKERRAGKRAKHMGLTDDKQLRATANRNALLALMRRHAGEFDALVKFELKRLQALDKDPDVKKVWIAAGAI